MLTGVLRARPDDVEALCLLARCQQLAGDPPGMLAATDRALAVAPGHEWALRLRSRALLRLKRPRAAVRAARAAVAAAPNEWRTHATLAEVLLQRPGVWWAVAARLSADAVLRLAPEEADAHVVDAQVCLRTGELAAARRACLRALERDPENQAALHNLALTELNLQRVGRAARRFSAALAVAPDDRVTGAAHGDGARAVLWRLFDALAVATLLHVAVFSTSAGSLGPWQRPIALAAAVVVLAGFGLLCRRAWRAQPQAFRWRLRAEWQRSGVALWPVAVAAAAVALTIGAYRPAPDTVADELRVLGLLVVGITLVVRLLDLLLRGARIVLVRSAYRAALGVHRGWARLRRGRGPTATAAGG